VLIWLPTSRRCGSVARALVDCTSVGSLKVVSVRKPHPPFQYCLTPAEIRRKNCVDWARRPPSGPAYGSPALAAGWPASRVWEIPGLPGRGVQDRDSRGAWLRTRAVRTLRPRGPLTIDADRLVIGNGSRRLHRAG
jgi:hypothetical protein